MIAFPGIFYDGVTAAGHEVTVSVYDDGTVRVAGDGVDRTYRFAEVRVSSRLGDTPRFVHFPDGAKVETSAHDAVDAALGNQGGQAGHRLLHRFESRLGYAVAALAITVGAIWGIVHYGVPYLSERVARAIPDSVENSLGRDGLAALDRVVLEPSRLDELARKRVHRIFDTVADGVEHDLRLELRASPRLGANALALPGGIVVVTDELANLMAEDGELLAVIAHEAGHVQDRHVMRQILQGSLTALLLATLVGDFTSITGLSATLPTYLVDAKYSRDFEREADRYAAAFLAGNGVSPLRLRDALRRLEAESPGDGGTLAGYLSTHPATADRIAALEGLAGGSGDSGR